MYIIAHREDESQAFNFQQGWTTITQAQYFTDEEKESTKLPPEGYWCPLWSLDQIQFARFIASCQELGLLNQRAIQKLAEHMNCKLHNVENIIDRAKDRFDEVCMKILEVYEKDFQHDKELEG